MAAGDVEIRIVSANVTDVDTALTAMRVTAGANGHYGMCTINNGQNILIFAVTEA